MQTTAGFTKNITMHSPGTIVFGKGSFIQFVNDTQKGRKKRLFVLTISELEAEIKKELNKFHRKNISININSEIKSEPSFNDYKRILMEARKFGADSIVGIGGGSVLDTAKLLAATVDTDVSVEGFLAGKRKLQRKINLICLPTTAGTGSEVSPNAIFFNPEDGSKTAVIDPCLIPDAVYVDPQLMKGVPPVVTAFTGLDALTHCIEAYVNRFSHPVTDLIALEGITLIAQNLKKAFLNGKDLDAREKVALGSMYGGMCLGPVNTAAVHALAYPLGSKYKIAHGISNAMLLPHVMKYNLDASVAKYARIGSALGVQSGTTEREIALKGIEIIEELIHDFGLPKKLTEVNITESEIENLAKSAMKVQRLLKNNVKEITLIDAINIYKNLV